MYSDPDMGGVGIALLHGSILLGAAKFEDAPERLRFDKGQEVYSDPDMGGAEIALPHGSILIEAAKFEIVSSSTNSAVPVDTDDQVNFIHRIDPYRINVVFYQHRNMLSNLHGPSSLWIGCATGLHL